MKAIHLKEIRDIKQHMNVQEWETRNEVDQLKEEIRRLRKDYYLEMDKRILLEEQKMK